MNYPHSTAYCRVGISPIHGVGVIAVVDIPKGTSVFVGEEPPTSVVPKSVVDALPDGQKKLYEDFAVLEGESYICPFDLSELSVGWFFNHSTAPNVGCRIVKTRCDGFDFYANRDIKAGSELTLDYDGYEKMYLMVHHQKASTSHLSSRKRVAQVV